MWPSTTRHQRHRSQAESAAAGEHAADFEVTVRDGIVTISGPPQNEQVAHALLEAARHVEGVVAVRDRFS
jgi:osmotically-inducible protein OsmY